MNFIDVILLVCIAWGVYRGFTRGFIIELASLLALVLGIWGAIRFSGLTADWLMRQFEMTGRYLPVMAFAVTFLLIVIGVHLLARLIDGLVKAIALGLLNRLMGVVFGVFKVAFVLSIILVILNTIHRQIPFLPEKKIEESVLYGPCLKLAPAVFPYLNFEDIKKKLKPAPADSTAVPV